MVSAVVVGANIMETSDPATLRRSIGRMPSRVLLCGDSCDPAAAVEWSNSGVGEFVRECDLPEVLRAVPGTRRPRAALDRLRCALAALLRTLNSPRTLHAVADANVLLAALPRVASMNNAVWASAAGISEATLDRRCRRAWGVAPGEVTDCYAAAVVHELTQAGVARSQIARCLGYAHRKSLSQVVARARRGPLNEHLARGSSQ